MTDPETLWASRNAIRAAYHSIRRLRRAGDVSDVLDRLDALAVELTRRLEAIEPEMDLRSVWVVPVGA